MKIHSDIRGTLYEIPSCAGTQFISTSHPGVRRGDHYHLHKTEWFLVLVGEAEILHRPFTLDGVYGVTRLSGDKPEWVGILPLVTHAIVNIGKTDLVLLVQSDVVFDEANPDTYDEKV